MLQICSVYKLSMDHFPLVGIHAIFLYFATLETNIRGHFWEGGKHGGRKTEPLEHFCFVILKDSGIVETLCCFGSGGRTVILQTKSRGFNHWPPAVGMLKCPWARHQTLNVGISIRNDSSRTEDILSLQPQLLGWNMQQVCQVFLQLINSLFWGDHAAKELIWGVGICLTWAMVMIWLHQACLNTVWGLDVWGDSTDAL